MRPLVIICFVAMAGCVGETGATSASTNDAGTDAVSVPDSSTDASTDFGSDAQADGGGEVLGYRTLSSLTLNEREEVCADLAATYDELLPPMERIRFNCTVSGIFTAGFDPSVDTDEELQQACVPVYDMCLKQNPSAEEFVCPVQDAVPCIQTVGELKTCFEDEATATAEFFATVTCEEATIAQTEEMGLGEPPLPESCRALYEACPQLQ